MLTLVGPGGIEVVQSINLFQSRTLPPWPHGQVFRVSCLAETRTLARSDAVLMFTMSMVIFNLSFGAKCRSRLTTRAFSLCFRLEFTHLQSMKIWNVYLVSASRCCSETRCGSQLEARRGQEQTIRG